ncbi:MAG: PQQ-binding-like beta-propeller repeat protein [Planctomycetes bacterium]|nr:PQQ-binding-like beta-propeller repeat protein [Planctomycetota bacterium]
MRSLTSLLVLLVAAGCSRGDSVPQKSGPLPAAAQAGERGIGEYPQLDAAGDWPWWRGPTRNGVAHAGAKPPVEFGDEKNVVWRTPVPGHGHSSPVVVGEKIYLTTADVAARTQSLLAFERATGRPLWSTEVNRGNFPAEIHPNNTHATPTVACDGRQLIVVMIHDKQVNLTWLDLDGKILRQQAVGPFHPQRYEFGYGPSPLLYKNLVIVASEFDGESFLAAFDTAGGKEAWRVKRPSNISFSSPVVAPLAGRDQMVLSGSDSVASYDPASGELLWSTAAGTTATCGTAVWVDDIIMTSGGFPDSITCAVKADGSGKLLWENKQKCYEQSMLAHDGHLYALTDNGIAYCWRASDGQEMWKQRLKGPVSSSPVLADGRIYWANERGTHYVCKATPASFELLAENQLGDESFASPAALGDKLYIRAASGAGGSRQEYLYCLGEKR